MRIEANDNESLLRSQYLNKEFGLHDAILEKIQKTAEENRVLGMQISSSEGRILHTLVQWFQPQKIVEVGLLYGFSTLCMARALPREGCIYSLEKSEENLSIASEFLKQAGVMDQVQLILGDAEEKLKDLVKEGPFDMIFIDANKAAYGRYLDWAEENIRSGGLIVGDNTFLFGGVYGGRPRDSQFGEKQIQIMQEFNRRLANQDKYNSCLIPTSEGLTIAQKR